MLEIFNALIACLITTITLYIAGTIIFGKSKNTTLKNILVILVCTKQYLCVQYLQWFLKLFLKVIYQSLF